MVDELDRARPNYAVEFLESLKHFFDVKNIVFVLAVNREQIEKSVKCLYGELDFNEYYRKFATSNISLPYFLGDSQEYITKKFTEISSKLENKFSLDYSSLNYFILVFKLSPRQINEFLKIFLYMRNNSSEMMLAICLHIKDPKETKRIAEGNYSWNDFERLAENNQNPQDDIIKQDVKKILVKYEDCLKDGQFSLLQKYAKDILNVQNMISFL